MFMQVKKGIKHPEAGPSHKCTQQMLTVVVGYPRYYQIRVIKLIRGSKVLNQQKKFMSNVSQYNL